MIAKPFDKPEPSDPRLHAGWEAEKDLAFYLEREFGPHRDIFVFNDLRFADVSTDFTQIDHLVLYRHGIAIIESKSVSGELEVDRLGQWRRRWRARSGRTDEENFADPFAQAERQATSLRRVLDRAEPPLLNKIAGLVQTWFGNFPIRPFVAISTNGRFSGHTGPFQGKVLKADQITRAINDQIAHHRRNSGMKSLIFSKPEDLTVFNLTDDELNRISGFLTNRHTPARPPARIDAPASHRTATPAPASLAPGRIERPEALCCAKCKSINVRIIYARDYCLKCDECGKFSSLAYTCPLCGKHATIRKDGPIYFRDCDAQDGCRTQTLFSRST